MNYLIKPMEEAFVLKASKWIYGDIYSIYDMDGSPDTVKELMEEKYYEVFNDNGPIGFFCFGQAAIVPGIVPQGAYEDEEYLDIGLGMNPELVGKGLGYEFLMHGLNFAWANFGTGKFRLTVVAFNERAIKVYERVGFRRKGSYINRTPGGEREVIVMLLDEIRWI